MLPVLYFIMKVSGMIRLNTTEYKFILIVVFLNFNLLLLLKEMSGYKEFIICNIYSSNYWPW